MKLSAQENILDNHARATWNVWNEHRRTCNQCQPYDNRTYNSEKLCLSGKAAIDEWRIAESRLDDYRYGVQSA